jgi:hypothetical protein
VDALSFSLSLSLFFSLSFSVVLGNAVVLAARGTEKTILTRRDLAPISVLETGH